MACLPKSLPDNDGSEFLLQLGSPLDLNWEHVFPESLLLHLVTSLVAQMVKHLPTMRETWVRSVGREDLLEKEIATHSSILCLKKFHGLKSLVGYSP